MSDTFLSDAFESSDPRALRPKKPIAPRDATSVVPRVGPHRPTDDIDFRDPGTQPDIQRMLHAPSQGTPPAQSAHQDGAVHHLIRALHALVAPTAGAEEPVSGSGPTAPLPDIDTDSRDVQAQQVKDKFRHTTDPAELARIKRRMSR